jgi:type IV pilus assembly protein PilQ
MRSIITFIGVLLSISINANSGVISLKFDNADIDLVLKAIAEHQQINLMTSDDVQGKVSIDLEDVDWQTALQQLLMMKGLEYQLSNNTLLVTPLGKLAEYKIKKREDDKKVMDVGVIVSKVVAIKYSKASELAETLLLNKSNLLSPQGSITVNKRTNSLLLQDTAASLLKLTNIINQLDTFSQQVLIEARMVTIRENLDEQFGVQWGLTDSSRSGNKILSGSLESIEQINQRQSASYLDRLNVNLPVANPAGRVAMQLAKLSDGSLLDLQLSVIERESKGEVVAAPRILATDQHTSRIEQGTEIPYLQAAAHGATSVAFKKAVLSLEVTPQITPSGHIILELNITQDARGDTVVTSAGPAVAIDTQQIKTTVSVNNGETLVLGGIYQQQMVKSVSKVPWFAELPYIGWLFRTDNSYNEKRELLVFVTPKILASQ